MSFARAAVARQRLGTYARCRVGLELAAARAERRKALTMRQIPSCILALLLASVASAQNPLPAPPTRDQMTPAERAAYDAAPPESKRTAPPTRAGIAPAADPTTQPRVQKADVTRVGSIFMPPGVGNPNALSVDGDVIYVGCYFGAGKTGVATVQMPAIGGTAKLLTPCSQLPNLTQGHMGGTYIDFITSGLIVWNGRLNVGATAYYDGSSGQVRSQWVGTATSLTGPFEMVVSDVGKWTDHTPRWRQSFVGGFKGFIAPEWRTLFGGPAFSGGCCFPIIFGRPLGPSVSVYDPDHVGIVNPIPSKMALGFPYEHPMLGRWEDSPPKPYYGGTDQMGGVGFPSGTRSVLFTSRHGDNMCYGPGTPNQALVGTIDKNVSDYPYCYDPFDKGQGNHGPPYRPTMTAVDATDMLKVAQGLLKPWDVQPYAKWELPDLPLDRPWYLRAGWYDDARRWFLVGDTSSNEVQIFAIGGGSVVTDKNAVCGTPVVTLSPWTPEACPAPPAKPEQFATETTTTPTLEAAVGNGKACPSPTTRQVSRPCEPIQPPDTCAVSPLVVTGIAWPGITEGSRSGRFTWSVAGLVVQLQSANFEFNPTRLVITDSRGCSKTVTR